MKDNSIPSIGGERNACVRWSFRMLRVLVLGLSFFPWMLGIYLVSTWGAPKYSELQLALGGDLDGAQQLIAEKKFGELKGDGGFTPLTSALVHAFVYEDISRRTGWNHVVSSLLSAGADPNELSVFGPPLHIAALRNNPDVIRNLIAYGAEVNRRDCEGETALMVAVKAGGIDAVRELLHAGADPAIALRGNETAISLAKSDEIKALIRSAPSKTRQ